MLSCRAQLPSSRFRPGTCTCSRVQALPGLFLAEGTDFSFEGLAVSADLAALSCHLSRRAADIQQSCDRLLPTFQNLGINQEIVVLASIAFSTFSLAVNFLGGEGAASQAAAGCSCTAADALTSLL